MMPKFIVHLNSGGLDSVTLMHELLQQGHQLHSLSVNYQQPHVKELECARRQAMRCGVRHTVIQLPPLGGLTEESWIVPNRNAILLSVGVNYACHAKADTVTIGCNADDAGYFPDCRQPFIDAMNAAVRAAGYGVEICAPYINKMKWEIGGLAQEMGIKPDEIWSCYHGGEQPCGKCPACQKLALAFGK